MLAHTHTDKKIDTYILPPVTSVYSFINKVQISTDTSNKSCKTDSCVDISIRGDRDDSAADMTLILFTQLISNHLTMWQVISADRIIWSSISDVCWDMTWILKLSTSCIASTKQHNCLLSGYQMCNAKRTWFNLAFWGKSSMLHVHFLSTLESFLPCEIKSISHYRGSVWKVQCCISIEQCWTVLNKSHCLKFSFWDRN